MQDLINKNMEIFLKHGPGLRYSYSELVEGRDRKRKRVLLAGLGGMGVGKMWFEEEPWHADLPGYEDAPEVDSWMQFGTLESDIGASERG